MFQRGTRGVIMMLKNKGLLSQKVCGDAGNWSNALLSWSATSSSQPLFRVHLGTAGSKLPLARPATAVPKRTVFERFIVAADARII